MDEAAKTEYVRERALEVYVAELADVLAERGGEYGDFERSMNLVGRFWELAFGRTFTASDVSLAMVLFKAARIVGSPGGGDGDDWLDVGGYAGGGFQANRFEEMMQPVPGGLDDER